MDLAEIADRLLIEDLFVRYTTALDRGDVETIVECFTADGALESPVVGAYRGRDAIREFAGRYARFHEKGAQLRHLVSNLAVTIDGERATATCYLLTMLTRDGRTEMLPPGRYECDLAKVSGQWLFRRRLVILDRPLQLDGV